MSDVIIVEGVIDEDGKLVVELPPDAPRGKVEVLIRRQEAVEPLRPEDTVLDPEMEALLTAESLSSAGEPVQDVLNSPEIGAWADRTDIPDGETYVEQLRAKTRRYIW